MRPYEVLDTEQLLHYFDLVTNHFHIVENFTIAPPSVEFDDYGLSFTFQVGTKQETSDEYIFNEGDEFTFGVESESQLGFFDDMAVYVTFYYYELDKADIDDSKSYDELKTLPLIFRFRQSDPREITTTFEKPTYLLKDFQVELKQWE